MSAQREFGHGVVVAGETDGLGVADFVDDIDATTRILDAEATTCQDLLVALGVKLGEALTELKLLTINHDGAVGALLAFHGVIGQSIRVDAEEITHTGLLQFKVARHAVVGGHKVEGALSGLLQP